MMKKLSLLIVFWVSGISFASAQCSMCRTTLENNVSNGNIGIAAGINFGILYLFFAPYIAVAVIAWLWYRTSKSNERKELQKRTFLR